MWLEVFVRGGEKWFFDHFCVNTSSVHLSRIKFFVVETSYCWNKSDKKGSGLKCIHELTESLRWHRSRSNDAISTDAGECQWRHSLDVIYFRLRSSCRIIRASRHINEYRCVSHANRVRCKQRCWWRHTNIWRRRTGKWRHCSRIHRRSDVHKSMAKLSVQWSDFWVNVYRLKTNFQYMKTERIEHVTKFCFR